MAIAENNWTPEDSSRADDNPDMVGYHRSWQTNSSYPALDNTSGHAVFGSAPVDSSIRPITSPQHSSDSDVRETAWPTQPISSNSELTHHQHRHPQESFSTTGAGSNHQIDGAAYPAPNNGYYPNADYSKTLSQPHSSIPPLPRHQYTRTLVGPLAANACRLLDEHRKPGIFFLFQDLSVRTEGVWVWVPIPNSVI
jgi:hypothetical protein